ncbi:tyrosine-type recombinase/integrase [Allosphingosinicella sp.]|jgi:integrase|uniref:tyrosine-type recombinase/integrase n=1 Tax=Allosphingosinicella sp. TaxID=2823234 RepID=UPI002F1553A0
MVGLTAVEVRNAKAGRHADGKGLYLLVKPSGAKSWVLRVQVGGRRRDYGLGSLDLVTLQEARDRALEYRKAAKSGLDPSLERKKAQRTIPTFEEAARRYHAAVRASWRNGKHADQWLSTLQAHVFPTLGSTHVHQIDAPMVQSVLLPIWLTLPETARRVRQRVGSVLDYAHGQGWRATETPRNAINSLMKRIKQPRRGGGFAAMPYAELPAFMGRLEKGSPTVGRLALQFLILTAARSGEVRGALWEEIDFDKAQWTIPAARMKAGEAHSVPLTPAAVEVLRQVREITTVRQGQPIFPGLKGQPLSDATLAKVLRVGGGGAYTVHGMRSAFRDWIAEQTTFPGDWAEAALAHTLPNKVEAAYKRTKFLDQRRKLMEAWADYLGGASNVLKLAS